MQKAIDSQRLVRLDTRPGLRTSVRALFGSRELVAAIARANLHSRHGSTALGRLWNVLDPLLMLGVYWIIFGSLLAGRRPENFIAFLAVGLFLFRFAQTTITAGAASIGRSLGMIRQVRFPRAALIAAETLQQLGVLAWQLPVIAAIVIVTSRRLPATSGLLVVVVIPLLALFAFGGGLLFARLAHSVRDVNQLLPYGFRILFYGTGVLFPIDELLTGSPLARWLPLNPFYAFISLARHLLLAPRDDAPVLWVSAISWTAVSLVVGLTAFVRAEHRYGRG